MALNDGDTLADNPEGRRDMVRMPWDDSYADFGKQFREPFQWLDASFDTLQMKKSPILDQTVAIFGGVDTFGRPIAAVQDGHLMSFMKHMGYAASQFTPFGIRNAHRVWTGTDHPELAPFALAGFPIKFGTPPSEGGGGGDASPAPSAAGRLIAPRGLDTQSFRRDFARARQAIPF